MAAPMAGLQGLYGPQVTPLDLGGSFFKSRQPSIIQAPTANAQQQQASLQALMMALQGLQNPQSGFQPIANEARQQFQQQTIPSIAERFTQLGGQRSNAFGQQLGAAGAGLESSLASQGAQYSLQSRGLLQALLQLGLHPQFENVFTPSQPSGFENLLNTLYDRAQTAGKAFAGGI